MIPPVWRSGSQQLVSLLLYMIGEQGVNHELDTSWLDMISLLMIPPVLENRDLSHRLDATLLDMISLLLIPPGWSTGSWGISWTLHGLTWFLYSWSLQVGEQWAEPSVDTSRLDMIPLLMIRPGWRTGIWAVSWTLHCLKWILYSWSLQVGEHGLSHHLRHLTAWHDSSTCDPSENRELRHQLQTSQLDMIPQMSCQLETSLLDVIPLLVNPPGWRTGSWFISWAPHEWHTVIPLLMIPPCSRLENRELSHQLDTSRVT